MADSLRALPEPYKHRGGCLQGTIRMSSGSQIEVWEKGQKELRRYITPWGEQKCQLTRPSRDPGDCTTNQMAMTTYVAEDVLVGHQGDKRPLVLMPECRGICWQGVGWVEEYPHRSMWRGSWIDDFQGRGKQGKEITLEI